MKLGELKTGDIFYIIHWEGGYIGHINTCIVKDFLPIKLGRIIHYTITDETDDTVHGVTLEFNEYENEIAQAYYVTQMCSNKELLINLLKNDKEKFIERQNIILRKIND